jgi:hypothetical protein
LAGVGLESGRQLDDAAPAANAFLIDANYYIMTGDNEGAITAFTNLANIIFTIAPFVPNPFPQNWQAVLRAWLSGEPMADVAEDDEDALRFVENGLVYKLPWGMEALRVRAAAVGDAIMPGTTMNDYETGFAIPAIETGTLHRSAALLMQAGFNSRLAAIKAIADTGANFESNQGLAEWLASEQVVNFSNTADWPTAETAEIWRSFVATFTPPDRTKWTDWTYSASIAWETGGNRPAAGAVVRIAPSNENDSSLVLAPDHTLLGTLVRPLNPSRKGLIRAAIGADRESAALRYIGPPDLTPSQLV